MTRATRLLVPRSVFEFLSRTHRNINTMGHGASCLNGRPGAADQTTASPSNNHSVSSFTPLQPTVIFFYRVFPFCIHCYLLLESLSVILKSSPVALLLPTVIIRGRSSSIPIYSNVCKYRFIDFKRFFFVDRRVIDSTVPTTTRTCARWCQSWRWSWRSGRRASTPCRTRRSTWSGVWRSVTTRLEGCSERSTSSRYRPFWSSTHHFAAELTNMWCERPDRRSRRHETLHALCLERAIHHSSIWDFLIK